MKLQNKFTCITLDDKFIQGVFQNGNRFERVLKNPLELMDKSFNFHDIYKIGITPFGKKFCRIEWLTFDNVTVQKYDCAINSISFPILANGGDDRSIYYSDAFLEMIFDFGPDFNY